MAALTTADCNAINTAIVRETGRIGPEIYTRVVRSSVPGSGSPQVTPGLTAWG